MVSPTAAVLAIVKISDSIFSLKINFQRRLLKNI